MNFADMGKTSVCMSRDPLCHRNRYNRELEEDMALAQREMSLRKRAADVWHPAFVVRAPDPNNRGRWITLGYAWSRKNGEEGYSVKLSSIPVGSWDTFSFYYHRSPTRWRKVKSAEPK